MTERIERALALAEELYSHRTHWIGIPLAEHVADTLRILAPFSPDEDAVIGCLLHHALDPKTITLADVEEQFGKPVRDIVANVHLLSQIHLESSRTSIGQLRQTFLAVSDDLRAVLILLCDRASLLNFLDRMTPDDRRWLASNVLQLFAPVAARLGIHSLKQRMEQSTFPLLYPTDAEQIAEQMAALSQRMGSVLTEAAERMQALLREEGIAATVQCREKQPYSIFQKMRAKSLSSIHDIHDLFALRVLVPEESDCYRALGVLHRLGTPVTMRFKDYISFPKPNGYRSLHTTMTRLPGIPEGVFVEVQVRTPAMHREAEFGVAAHWEYKQGGGSSGTLRPRLHTLLSDDESSELPAPLPSEHIFVLTPRGDVIELPEGATPLDFAFQIHTSLGLSFKAAKVNGAIVAMDHELENGDTVEIVRHREPRPSAEWMKLLKMASSRSRLKHYLADQHRDAYVTRGKQLLNELLAKHHCPPLDSEYNVLRVYDGRTLKRSEREDILMKIGQGSEKVSAVLDHLIILPGAKKPKDRSKPPSPLRSVVEVAGGLPMPIRFGQCCKPEIGEREPIVGFIGRGAVIIHKRACRNAKITNQEKRVGAKWASERRNGKASADVATRASTR